MKTTVSLNEVVTTFQNVKLKLAIIPCASVKCSKQFVCVLLSSLCKSKYCQRNITDKNYADDQLIAKTTKIHLSKICSFVLYSGFLLRIKILVK